MKTTLSTIFFLFSMLMFNPMVAQETTRIVSGGVTQLGEPLVGAKVTVLETGESVFTDSSGRYEIRADEKETISFSHDGLRTVEIIVEDVTKILNVTMQSEITKLNEVVVTEAKLSRQDSLEFRYQYGEGVVKGAFGFIDKRSSALSMRVIEEDRILESFDLIDIVRRVQPGARLTFNDVGIPTGIVVSQRFCILGGNCRSAGFDIDGFLTLEFPFIPLAEIKRIAVITTPQYGLYGRFATAGLIVINTKTGQFVKGRSEPYDYAKLRNNIFNGDAKSYYKLNQDSSEYSKLLRNASGKEESMAIFEERENLFGTSPDFYFNTASFFLTKMRDEKTYVSVLKKMEKKFDTNANVLKAVAYRYEEMGAMDKANEVYTKIFKLRPGYGQSYRDLANSFKKMGDSIIALELISRYKKAVVDFNINEGTVKSEIDSILSTEAKSLATTGKALLKKELKQELKNEVWPIRVMVEWNNSDAEFDIQLVNPEGHYYTWNHTLEKNKEFIRDEKIRGFSSKQFYMDSTPAGKWQVNVKYYGNKSFDDTYLKVTAYTNYGSYSQSERSEIYRLSSKNVNQELMTIATPIRSVLSSN